jgi:hypothetical protein
MTVDDMLLVRISHMDPTRRDLPASRYGLVRSYPHYPKVVFG